MPRPISGTFQPYTILYISKVPEDNVSDAFKNQEEWIAHFFDSIPSDKWDYAYAPDKWTLKEILQHIIDTERIFAYRALCIARKETQNLPGFDENEYAANSNGNNRSWQSLVQELQLVRETTELLFNSFSPETLSQYGISNNNTVTVNSIGFIIVGHLYHHIEVIKEKYLAIFP
jgi:hypothetical protein